MHLVFISSILTLRHTSPYPDSPAFWPSADPFIPRSNETYSPAGCSIAEPLKEIQKVFSLLHREIIATVARRETNLFVVSPLAISIAMSLLTSPPVEQDTPTNRTELQTVECLQKIGVQPFIDYLNVSLPKNLVFQDVLIHNNHNEKNGQIEIGSQGYAYTGLRMAASVFVSPKVNLRSEFIQTVTKTFRAPLRRLDFEEPTERQNFINFWGAGKTQSLVQADTSMALVNVIRYKGEWLQKFHPGNTHKTEHTERSTNRKIVKSTMFIEENFLRGYHPQIRAYFTELPLKSKDGQKHLSMFLIIPDSVARSSPLFDASHHISNISIEELRSYGTQTIRSTFVPKIKIESTMDVKSAAESMMPGNSIFEQQTKKLSHVADSPKLVGDKFVQRTCIEINEEGVEALTIDTAADPPVPDSIETVGTNLVTFYVLLVTASDTPQIIFSGRAYN